MVGAQQRDTNEGLGQFRLTWYQALGPFSGFSSATKMTLCSSATDFCVEDSKLQLWPDPEFGTPPFTLVTGYENQNLTHFLDTAAGSEVRCRNCDTPLAQPYRESSGLWWSPSGKRAALGSSEKARSPFLIELEFEARGITASRIAVPRDALAVHPRELGFSPNSDVLAWFECAPNCVLWSYRISDRRAERRPTPCPYNDYLDIGWEGDTPRPQFYGGAPPLPCFDANGKLEWPKGGTPFR